MKNIRNTNIILVIVLVIFTGIQISVAVSPAKRTRAVFYENTWIPSIQLREVKIASTRIKGQSLTPVKDLIGFRGSFHSKPGSIFVNGTVKSIISESYNTVKVPHIAGYRAKLVYYDNTWIPSFDLSEVTICADRQLLKSSAEASAATPVNTGLFKVSARESFDVLLAFLVEQGSILLKHFFPKDISG